MTRFWRSVETSLLSIALAMPAVVSAQASGEASSDIELGANQASEIEMSAGARAEGDDDDSASRPSLRGGDSDTRLGIQVRLDAVNVLREAEPNEINAALGSRLLVPIVAPGVRLLDEGALFLGLGFGFAGTDGSEGPGDEYSRNSGTSMAAPVVTGLAALLMAYYPGLDAREVRQIILDSATRLPDTRVVRPGTEDERVLFGTLSATGGIVNAYEALRLAEQRAR